jgi:phosphoglycolate phosphatase
MNLPKPSAIIFDWDNTLVDTWPIIHQALHETFEAMGLEPWSLDRVKTNVRKSMRDSFPEIFGPNWQDAATLYQARYRAHHLDKLTPLAGALELLQHLHARAIPMVVVSNKKGGNLRSEVEFLKWNDYFKNVVGADDAEKDKPHPHPVLHALKPLGISPSRTMWFIGDSDIDLETAKNTGCTPILYGEYAATQAAYTPTDFHGFPYSAHARRLSDVMGWV